MYTIGYDIGSSTVKGVVLDLDTGLLVARSFAPKGAMPISTPQLGWAEQHPRTWWENLKTVTHDILSSAAIDGSQIAGIGVAYQMHGLVLVDAAQHVLRPSIIWCDSRAVETGRHAFDAIGNERCLHSLLNSPGNFTTSRLKWVKDNEPAIYAQIHRAMLPGDYIAMRLTGEISTTVPGLSEGILWDFEKGERADFLLSHFGIDPSLIPPLVPTFGEQGRLCSLAAYELGLPEGIAVSYRAGDQPNNALSLNVLNPGEIAATAGTSGVVYGVSGEIRCDRESRVNSFAHVNYTKENPRLGILLCINGTGIANNWAKSIIGIDSLGYEHVNQHAESAPIGSAGLVMLPFGNGAERMLNGREIGAHLMNLNYNMHSHAHLARAVQEGVAFAFRYGMEIMAELEMKPHVIRAGMANMFLSDVFCDALASSSGVTIELYNTDGAQGAATGAALGLRYFASFADAFSALECKKTVEPDVRHIDQYAVAYDRWLTALQNMELLQERPCSNTP